jgi:hypothetical protein
MKSESCESKVSNLLAGLTNLPNAEKWSRGFDILVKCLGLQEKEIAELKRKLKV